MDRRVYDNYVFMVAKLGSLTKAANALGISQPALSSGLNSLEKDVGIKIFDRKCVPIAFTPEGEVYFEYIKRLKVLNNDFVRRVENLKSHRNTVAVIGGPVAYTQSIIPEAVMKLRKSNPDYKVSIKSSPLSDLVSLAEKGEINCFISTSESIPDKFEKRLIKKERIYLCIPTANPLNSVFKGCEISPDSEGKTIDYSLLDGQQFVFLEDKQPLQQQVSEFLEEMGVSAKSNIIVNQVSVAVNFAARGEGICFASDDALESNGSIEGICVYPLPDSVSGRNIYVAYDKELFMPKACSELIELLAQQTND